MKKLLACLWAFLLPLPTFSLSFGDASNSSIYYRVNDALISRAYIATSATAACIIKQYPDATTLPAPEKNVCSLKNIKTSPFFMTIRQDGCIKLTYFIQGNSRLLAGKTLLTCPQVNSKTGNITSFAKLTTYTDIGGNDETSTGDTPPLFRQKTNFTQDLALLGTDFSGSVFVNTELLYEKAAALQASYEEYLNSTGETTDPTNTQTTYIST